MKVWQIIVLAVGVFIAAIAAFVYLIFQMTSGVVETGDEFFAAAGSGNYEAAFALTSEDLQRETTVEGLAEYIETNGFDTVAETSWSSRSINNDTGSLSGSLTTRSGGTIPVQMSLVKEGDEWRISYIEKARSGLAGDND